MALIKCPDCNKDISEYAEKCPHCGCPRTFFNEERFIICELHSINDIFGKRDYYLTNDETIAEKDYVIIQVKGFSMSVEDLGIIDKIYRVNNAAKSPYPIDKMDYIKRKLDDSDYITIINWHFQVLNGYIENKDYQSARDFINYFLKILDKYANKGYALGQFAYGVLINTYFGAEKDAMYWIQKAANQGYQEAKNYLSTMQTKTIHKKEDDNYEYNDYLDYDDGSTADCWDYDEDGMPYEDYPNHDDW